MSRKAATEPPKRTVVLGLGNPVLCDDAVGLVVVAALQHLLNSDPIPGVDVLASTRAGFELLEMLRDYNRAVIVDCLVCHDAQPGRVRRLGVDDVSGCSRLIDAHEVSVGVAFRLAEELGLSFPMEVEIIGIEASDTTTIVEGLTPAVEAAVEPLAHEIYADLRRRAPAEEPPDSEEFRKRRAYYQPE